MPVRFLVMLLPAVVLNACAGLCPTSAAPGVAHVASLTALRSTLEAGGDAAKHIVVAPGTYGMEDAAGIRVPSNTTLSMYGATFAWSETITEDGQTFLLDGVENVTMLGGRVVGRREAWDPGTNVAGVRAVGACRDLVFRDMRFEDLSANGIGIFAPDAEHATRGVLVSGVRVENCCNYYGDYLSAERGPAKNSVREDQGGVAFYHVTDWVVEGSVFARSQSDGTHFYRSHDGRFADNVVRDSQMGGYFLEGCERVVATNNVITANGSRGVTIERDSRYCTLVNNVIEHSGREGLWAPDVAHCVVASNVFRENGRKDDGARDAEIRLDEGERYATVTEGILITNNIFITTAHQEHAIRVAGPVGTVTIEVNQFHLGAPGPGVSLEEVPEEGRGKVVVRGNTGLGK